MIGFVIFFWGPLEPQPHDVDAKALLQIAVVFNIPVACKGATADFLLFSPLMAQECLRVAPTPERSPQDGFPNPDLAPIGI